MFNKYAYAERFDLSVGLEKMLKIREKELLVHE